MGIRHVDASLPSRSPPESDAARQAVDSLRGYVYQALATALAWLDIEDNGRIYLEVAEDYAVFARQALRAVQIKDTERSGSITLNSKSVRSAIAAFVDLVNDNPDIAVELRLFTTSQIGIERALVDRPAGLAGLHYWRMVAAGADPEPLRRVLESNKHSDAVHAFCKARDNERLRLDLIGRVHWDCGKPAVQTLRQELEERLVVVGRELFQLAAPDALQLIDHLVYHVLEISTVDRAHDRVLTRSGLYSLIDAVTRISMPRSALADHSQIIAKLGDLLGAHSSRESLYTRGSAAWLVEGGTLPALRGTIARVGVESLVSEALRKFGVALLAGGTGLGKTVVARTVGDLHSGGYYMVNLRSASVEETCARLDMVFARVGGLQGSILILEDLDQLEDLQVSMAFARVIEALRRRYGSLIITSHRTPPLSVLRAADLHEGCIVDCPYFSEEESCALVSVYKGDPNVWGRLAHMAGGFGHPQLTHAFVHGMAARDWPIQEIGKVLKSGLSSDDINAARDAARRNLVSALPDGPRLLLYRLSLAFDRFDRSLALALGAISPSVLLSGESMDQLIGAWIEEVSNGEFRVSPLVRGSGSKILSPDEQRLIHNCVSAHMLKKGTIDASDIDAILMHAMAGKSVYCLTLIAHMVLSADTESLEKLAEHVLFFRFMKTDTPIYSEDAMVSATLRLAQFQLASAGLEESKVAAIIDALFDEIAGISESESKNLLEYTALIAVLSTLGVSNYVDNWIELLLRLRTIVEADDTLKALATDAEDEGGNNFFGGLFSIGSANLSSVERLENIIDQLGEMGTRQRISFLTPVDDSQSDYSSLVNGPWATSRHADEFDAADAEERYGRMARKSRRWGIRPLTLQCTVAQAIMLDEYLNRRDDALEVLEEAATTMGSDKILSRAKAKMYWRHDEHEKALSIFGSIADQIGIGSPVERAFALREAAISAAKCGAWRQAEEWFVEAQRTAATVQNGDMEVMAIGLGADSAVAALEVGDTGAALTRFEQALESLRGVDPEGSLRAAHCHRLVRYSVLWAQSRISGSDTRIGKGAVRAEAGMCSNPDPVPQIQEQSLSHLDIAWYVLAEAEIASNVDRGITSALADRLENGQIPSMELSLRRQMILMSISCFDPIRFSESFALYIEAETYWSSKGKDMRSNFNPAGPDRGEILALDFEEPFKVEVEEVALDTILTYGIHSIFENRRGVMSELEAALDQTFKSLFPGKSAFSQWNEETDKCGEADETIMPVLTRLSASSHLPPYEFWLAGLRLFEWISRSRFNEFLMPKLAAWQRSGWARILVKERFALATPMLTVPHIEETLRKLGDDMVFVSELLLVGSDAVGSPLASDYRQLLRRIADKEGTPAESL